SKYQRLKRNYSHRVHDLQDTIASQRISSSNIKLDDNAYVQMFERLEGATHNIAYNLRTHWHRLPVWLEIYVNEGALQAGGKEMTVVGKSFISRFLQECIENYFHPEIDTSTSRMLAAVEKNLKIRYGGVTDENKETRAAILSTWRKATMEGMQYQIHYSGKLWREVNVDNLVEYFKNYSGPWISWPGPAGIDDSLRGMFELALDIRGNMGHESREFRTMSFQPGSPIAAEFMKMENSLPPLIVNPSEDPNNSNNKGTSGDDNASIKSGNRKGPLAALRTRVTGGRDAEQPSTPSTPPTGAQQQEQKPPMPPPEADGVVIRMSTFMALEVINGAKNTVLYKAPCIHLQRQYRK
ncbi:hypothetical protein KEM55_006657, partial [Ascosphaera atra]